LQLQTIVVLYPRYPVIATDDLFTHEFYSEGPAGRIRKLILYERISENLLKETDDSRRSNNGDRDKVLLTVAFTAIDFTTRLPNAFLLIERSTAGRTRLYQITIGNNLQGINEHFDIYGLRQQNWEPFMQGVNYEAFLAQRK
jgi:hypothetical protein